MTKISIVHSVMKMSKFDNHTEKSRKQSEKLMIAAIKKIFDNIRVDIKGISSKWAEKKPEEAIIEWVTKNQDKIISDIKEIKANYIETDSLIQSLSYNDYQTAYAMQSYVTVQAFRRLGYDIKIKKYNHRQLEQAIKNPLSKYMDNLSIQADRNKSLNRLYNIIRDGFIQDKTLVQINKDLDIELGYRSKDGKLIKSAVNYKGQFYNRMRILRTELNRIRGAAETDNYINTKNKGIEEKLIIVETLDSRTRAQSAQMDGQEARSDGLFRFPDGRYAPRGNSGVARWDINDRSRTITILTEDNIYDYVRSNKLSGSIEIEPYNDFSNYADKIGMTKNEYGQFLWGKA